MARKGPTIKPSGAVVQSRDVTGKVIDLEAQVAYLETRAVLEITPDQLTFGSNVRAGDYLEGLESLIASIKAQGQIQPGTVRKVGTGYEVETGNRRASACMTLGVPFKAVLIDEGDRLIRQLIENVEREDLTPADKEKAVKKLVKKLGSQANTARILGKSEGWVSDAVTAQKLRTSEGKYPQNAPTAAITATKAVPKHKKQDAIGEAEARGGTVKAYRESAKKHQGDKPREQYEIEDPLKSLPADACMALKHLHESFKSYIKTLPHYFDFTIELLKEMDDTTLSLVNAMIQVAADHNDLASMRVLYDFTQEQGQSMGIIALEIQAKIGQSLIEKGEDDGPPEEM